MQVAADMQALKRKRLPVALAAGFFDGLHRGHRRVLSATVARAAALGGRPWVLTFAQHPQRVLGSGDTPRLLTSNRHKLMLLEQLGIAGCILLPFTRRFAALDPASFVRDLRAAAPCLDVVLVGRNWRFGRAGAGDARLLRALGTELGFAVTVVSPVMRGGSPVSSTRVRAAVHAGDLAEARALLGRPFSILGTVKRGRGVGRRLGYPTANLDPHNEVLPPHGAYCVRAALGGQTFGGVLNCGVRPTFGRASGTRPTIELHLLDVDRDLYGQDIEVHFVEHIRKECRFADPDQLKRRIARDIETARTCLR